MRGVFTDTLTAGSYALAAGGALLLDSFTSSSASNAATAAALSNVYNSSLRLTGGSVDGSVTVTGTLTAGSLTAGSYALAMGGSLLLDSFASSSASNAATAAALSNAYGSSLRTSGGMVAGNLSVAGNFTVTGTTTTLNTQELTVADNIIVLNQGFSNATPPTTFLSGICVNRGTESNYYFMLEEASQYFKVSTSNALQAVCTRDDNLSAGFPYFDPATKKLVSRSLSNSDVVDAPWLFATSNNGLKNTYFTTNSNGPFTGIGTSNPDYKLTVNGQIYTSDDIVAFSDRRLKTDLVVIPDALDKVRQLSGYTFTKVGSTRVTAGLVAQEVQAVLPEVVYQNEQGYLSIAYGNVVALLVEAVKALDARVATLLPAA
ncbi:hypothetical protein HYH03_011078 [Edaphochlamys debaryana]|uniref:Peptidase S74 domain-containing protein n=1 Tax=Edaphochlamys debaryana TaxID=47281 RepID=A0A835XSL1_9CHLO|nr:hypothetical protein HYH03_011078 [Edaphochlamys debaryana]|eukprot:KAG2490442.1 hypothetical protein HYH03_011078 [Edaphochlamys debaryana]